MAKKVLLVLVLASVLAGGVWAQDAAESGSPGIVGWLQSLPLSTGGGLRMDMSNLSSISSDGAAYTYQDADYFGVGFFGFIDAKYAVLKLGMSFGNYTVKYQEGSSTPSTNAIPLGYFDFDLLAKWTFGPVLGGKLLWYPMAGIGYMACLYADKDGYEPADMGRFMFEVGIGADYAITPKLGVRADFFLGFGGASKIEKDLTEIGALVFKIDLAVSYKLK
jgi:opacity protein-like surface antigen